MDNERHLTEDTKSVETEKLPVSTKSEENAQTPADVKENESDTPEHYVAPPDGGWGWMVVFSSFLIHVIADGVVYSFGIFLIEFVEVFKAGRGAVSWVGSLQPAVTYTVGPLSSALTNRYGCRFVTILGAVIAGVGFIISMFAPNLYYLYVTAGIMAGVGFGLIYLPAIVCVAQYFEKRRSFATGLAVCGSGFGTFILAPITEQLIHMYSWRGTFLILGGVILNVVVCGIIFRPLETTECSEDSESEDATDKKPADSKDEKLALLSSSEKKFEDIEKKTEPLSESSRFHISEAGKLRGEGEGFESCEIVSLSNGGLNNTNKNHQENGSPNGTCQSDTENNTLVSTLYTFEISTPPETPPSEFPSEVDNSLLQMSTSQYLVVPGRGNVQNVSQIAASDGALHLLSPQSATSRGGASERHKVGGRHIRRRLNSQESTPPSTPRPLVRKDIFYSGSLLNIPMFKSNPDLYITAVTPVVDHQKRHSVADEPDTKVCPCLDVFAEIHSTLREMLSFSLLKNPVFLMFGISNFLTSIGFNMPFIFLPDRAILAGIDDNRAAFLLSVIGIANTCGRVVFGFLSDRSWVNRLFLYSTALTICGLATALSPIIGGQYGLLVAYAAVFGCFIGVYVSLTSIVLVDLLGLEYLTNSFGLLLLFQGAATFIGPPIAGWIYDWTGSYDISFILMGSLIALSGAMLYLLPFVERRYNRKVPMEHIVHDMEMGKHKVKDGEDTNSL